MHQDPNAARFVYSYKYDDPALKAFEHAIGHSHEIDFFNIREANNRGTNKSAQDIGSQIQKAILAAALDVGTVRMEEPLHSPQFVSHSKDCDC